MAMGATASVLEAICRKFRGVLERERDDETPEEAEARRGVTYNQLSDGRMRFVIDLPKDEGARFLAAIDSAASELKASPDDSAETPRPKRRRPSRADGLMIVTESFLANGPKKRRGGAPHEVVLHVTKTELEQKTEGAFIANAGG